MHTPNEQELDRWEAQAADTSRPGGHPEIDARVLEMTRITVARIDENPELLRTGRENIERWTRQNDGYLPQCNTEWLDILETRTWDEIRKMLLEESDEGQRLRSSHPFHLITQDERRRINGHEDPKYDECYSLTTEEVLARWPRHLPAPAGDAEQDRP